MNDTIVVCLVIGAGIIGFLMAWCMAYRIGVSDGEDKVEAWYRAKRWSGDHNRVYHKGDAFTFKRSSETRPSKTGNK